MNSAKLCPPVAASLFILTILRIPQLQMNRKIPEISLLEVITFSILLHVATRCLHENPAKVKLKALAALQNIKIVPFPL
jgi:hypothetical protein